MVESELGDDREKFNNIPAGIIHENKDNGAKPKNNQVEEAPLLVEEGGKKDVQIIASPPPPPPP